MPRIKTTNVEQWFRELSKELNASSLQVFISHCGDQDECFIVSVITREANNTQFQENGARGKTLTEAISNLGEPGTSVDTLEAIR